MQSALIFGAFQHEIGHIQLAKLVGSARDDAGRDCVVVGSAGSLFVNAPRLEQQIELLFENGIDLVFSGEQAIARNAGRQLLAAGRHCLLRPGNLPSGAPGQSRVLFEKGPEPVWMVSVSDNSGKVLSEPAEIYLEGFFRNKIDNYPVLISMDGTDLEFKKSLFLKFSRSKEVSIWCGSGTGFRLGEPEFDSNGNVFIADTGRVATLNSIGGMSHEVWWKRNVEKIPVSPVPGWGTLNVDYTLIRMDESGRIKGAEVKSIKL